MQIVLDLPDALSRELQAVAHESRITPGTWAQEAVESALASRRLPYVEPAKCAPHHKGAVGVRDVESECMAEPYKVHCRIEGLEL